MLFQTCKLHDLYYTLTLPLVFILKRQLFQASNKNTQVIPCHYDVTSGELLPTEAFSTVPGAPTGVDGQTFTAAIRISGREMMPLDDPHRIHENGYCRCSYMNVVDVYSYSKYS